MHIQTNITVKSIDVYAIEDRLRKDKTKEGKEVWEYVRALKAAHERQKDLTATAIRKIRELSKPNI